MKGGYTEKFGIIPKQGGKKEVFRIFRQEFVVMLDILGLKKDYTESFRIINSYAYFLRKGEQTQVLLLRYD